jgi:hypothetical protein
MGESTVSLVSPSAARFFERAWSRHLARMSLLVGAGRSDHHLAMLFEVHQPIRHCQIVDVEQFAIALEGRRIFAVRIDHHDMAFRGHLADAVHDESGGGGLAGAGGAEKREMLAEHGVDIERAAHILGGIDGTDLDMRAVVGREHLLEIGSGHREDADARHGIA